MGGPSVTETPSKLTVIHKVARIQTAGTQGPEGGEGDPGPTGATGAIGTVSAALGADHTADGFKTADTNAGATIAFGQLCYFDTTDAEWKLADSNAEATTAGSLAIAMAAGADGAAMEVLLWGFVRDDSWSWTAGARLYAGTTAGALTATATTTTGETRRQVGQAITAKIVYFTPFYSYAKVA